MTQTVRVLDVGLLGKRSASDDFSLLHGDRAKLSPELLGELFAWLEAHIEAGNEQSVTVLLGRDGGWLIRASVAEGTDRTGRRLHTLAFGRVDLPKPRELMRLLFGAFNQRRPLGTEDDVCEIELHPESGVRVSPSARAAVLALATGASHVVLDSDTSAVAVIEQLGAEAIRFVSLMRRSLPTRWPRGPGVVVSQVFWEAPQRVRESALLNREHGEFDLAGLAGLAGVEGSGERRLTLAHGGLLGELADGSPWSEAELDWLLRSPRGRALAVAAADRAQLHIWVERGLIFESDLPAIADRLTPEAAPWIAELLAGKVDALAWFVGLFGPEAPGVERLLSDRVHTLWRRLRAGELEADESVDPHALTILDEAGLLEMLPLASLSRLRSQRGFEPRWRAALELAGMPARVCEILCEGGVGLDSAPADAPAPAPALDWIPGLSCSMLWQAGEWACTDARWRTWWSAAVCLHPELGPASLVLTERPWSPALAAWALGSLGAGELDRRTLLFALGSWRTQADPPPASWQHELFGALGFGSDRGLEAILSGSAPTHAPDSSSLATLRELTEHEVIDASKIVEFVATGADPVWLLGIGVGLDEVALLDERASPPRSPPNSWLPILDPLLARAALRSSFWDRFAGTVNVGLIAWLGERTSSRAGAVGLERLRGAFAGDIRLSISELEVVVNALPTPVLCGQLLAWARMPGSEREAAINLLLWTPGLRPALADWLASELLGGSVATPVPELAAGEMLVLLPLLHPTRDVLRPLLARVDVDPAETTLAGPLANAITRQEVPPQTPPAAAVLARHAALLHELVNVRGWAAWSSNESCERHD